MTYPSNYQLSANDLDNIYIGVDDTNYSFVNVTNRKTVIFGQGAISTTAIMYAIPNLGITGMAKPWVINTPKVDVDTVIVKGATGTAAYFLDINKNVDYVRGGFNFFENIPQTDLWQSTGTSNRSVPVQVGFTTNWNQVSAGYFSVLAIKTDGTLWAWGNNSNGQLGLNTTTAIFSTPVQVGNLNNWATVSSVKSALNVTNYSAAIKTDGTLWTWGNNSAGQLGLSDTTNRSSPVQVGTLSNWAQVSCGYASIVAIRTNGTLWSWGSNASGQLGNSGSLPVSTPIQIGSLSTWSQVASGSVGVVHAIKTDGTLWMWGYGNYYQSGNNSAVNFSSPIQVGTDSNWSQVTVGQFVSLAIKTDGTLWGWGSPTAGELGNNSATGTIVTPTQIGSDNWLFVKSASSSGSPASYGIKTNGTLWSWGTNTNGQLGLNTTGANILTPVQVGTLSNWSNIDTTPGNGFFLYGDGTLYSCGLNNIYQLGNQYDLARSDTIKRLTGF